MPDAIIISDSGNDTYSVSSLLRLQVDGRPAVIQNIRNFVENDGRIVGPVKGENEDNWHCAPKLNGIELLSRLRRDGFSVELIDSYYNERDRFKRLLADNPKMVVISTTFILNKNSLYELARDIRSLAPDIYIVAGGPFVYSSYLIMQRRNGDGYDVTSPSEDFLFLSDANRPDVDLYIVDMKGVWILSRALGLLKAGKAVSGLPNIARWDGRRYVFSRRSTADKDLECSCIDWDGMDSELFSSGAMNVQASYGCPFRCEFCNFVRGDRKGHVKPLAGLISELTRIADRGIRYVRFVDDNFRLGRSDLNAVCKAFVSEGLDLKWMSFIRASTLAKADLELLRRAGCIEVQMGVESADREVLKKMNKKSDPEMYSRVIRDLLDAGINCSCCFLAGFPGETAESFRRTVDFIESIPKGPQPGSFSWSIYPFLLVPLSPIYEPAKRARYGLSGYMSKWKHHSMDSGTAHRYIRDAFHEIGNSSPIYSGDNLEMMSELSPAKRKEFIRVRHNLSKRFLAAPYDRSLVVRSFAEILGRTPSGRSPSNPPRQNM